MVRPSMLNGCLVLGALAASVLAAPARASVHDARVAAAPTARDFMRVLDAHIQRAKPRDIFKRTLVFADVSAGAPEGKAFPFTTTATIHDYNPGWPPDHYYGKTCITRIVAMRYSMLRDRIGEWVVEVKPLPSPVCTDNSTEGVSAVPLDSLRGTRVGTSVALPELMTKKRVNVNLRLGEYACTWPGGRIASQMRFRLNRNRTYTDIDGARGGGYTFEQLGGTLRFRGGFLDKMGGKSVDDASVFTISPTLTCAPWG